MDTGKFITLTVGLLLAVIMVGAVFVPVVQSSTTRTITTSIENEGASWIKLGYSESADYDLDFTLNDDLISVNGQSGTADDIILYADSNACLMNVNGAMHIIVTDGDSTTVTELDHNVNLARTGGVVTVDDGTNLIEYSSTWAYYPLDTGKYGFFTESGLKLEEGKPTVAVGSYAHVIAYNDLVVAPNNYGDLGFVMTGDYSNSDVIWSVPETDSDIELTLTPLDPSVIHPISFDDENNLMYYPNPSYTDGVWGYEISGNNVLISTYLGQSTPGEPIITPTTLVGNAVNRFGYGGMSGEVFQTSIYAENLIISDGVVRILQYACRDCNNLTGTLSLPDTLEQIGAGAFRNSGFGGSLVLPDSLTTINIDAFYGTNFNGCLVLPENLSTVYSNIIANTDIDSLINLSNATFNGSFQNSSVKEVLNLGGAEFTTTSYGLNADSVQDYIGALGYIAPVSISETEIVPIESPVADLMQMLPLIAGVGALLLAVGTMIYTRW